MLKCGSTDGTARGVAVGRVPSALVRSPAPAETDGQIWTVPA
jgi:hypothetical protein